MSSIGTRICGSSSRGMTRTAKIPIASDATMNSGVSLELRNAFARRPAKSQVRIHGWTPLLSLDALAGEVAVPGACPRAVRRPQSRRELQLGRRAPRPASGSEAARFPGCRARRRSQASRARPRLIAEPGSPRAYRWELRRAVHARAQLAGRRQIDFDQEAVAGGIGRGNDLGDVAGQWLRDAVYGTLIFMPMCTAVNVDSSTVDLQLQRRPRDPLGAEARPARPWFRDRPCGP